MRQLVKPNQYIEVATPAEVAKLLEPPEVTSRIKAPQGVQLDANGNGIAEVFQVPTAMKFELRRIVFVLAGNVATDPVAGAIALNVAGHWIAYLKSGSLLEYAQPTYGSSLQVPGAQNWGSEQGPELQNKEVLEVQAHGLTANAQLNVYAEGILRGPRST